MHNEVMSNHTADHIEVLNCNHGGFYSVNDWDRDQPMLGQVQKLAPTRWAARVHGNYRDENPPTFATRRDAVAYLTSA